MKTGLVLLFSAAAYLIGSVPFGFLISKARGVDIRTQGSGNIGATNVFRCLSPAAGIVCFVLDVLKGFLPAFFFWRIAPGNEPAFGILYGAAAVTGHTFPVFLKFKGGKGVATGAGVLLAVAPLTVFFGLLVWGVVFYATGYVSLSSVCAAAAAAVTAWTAGYGPVTALVVTVLSGLSIWLHRVNIRRLLDGTENKFRRKTKTQKAGG